MTIAGSTRPTTLDEALARLDEAQDALRAIGAGEVDAFVVSDGLREPSIFGLSSVDRPYRTFFENMPGGAATVSAMGTVLYANDRLAEMLGVAKSTIVGAQLTSFVAGVITEEWHRVDADEAGRIVELDIIRASGPPVPVLVGRSPLEVDGERFTCVTFTDITERKAAEERTQRLSAIIESSSDAIIGMTLDRVITSWNPGAVTLFGYEADEAIGQKVSMLASPTVRGHVLSESEKPAGLSLRNVEVQCITKHRALANVSLSISPILDESGRPQGLSGIARSVAERIAFEHAAEQSRKRLVTAQQKAELDAIGRAEANRANRAKSEFLSRMSHELRTPLNAMLGFGQILAMDELSADQRESVGYIVGAGEHLLRLINDVLDISRIEAGAMQLALERVHLNEVVAEAVALIGPQAMQNDIALTAGIDGIEDMYVQSDRQRLLQVLLNLLSNAVKYNRPEGRVDITCASTDGGVSIAVTDTGVGMSRADLDKLFTPFERLGADRMGVEGTGVGLAVSRALSKEMGGTLTVTSTLGTGSTFTLELPTGQVSPMVDPADLPPEPVVAEPPAQSVTVLAIEDNVVNIRLLERIMQSCENAVLLTAIQGRIGLELAGQHHPDLVLLDLNMPDLSGVEVLERLKADPETAAIPVVICSGDASEAPRRTCLEAGAAAFLTKPFELDELYELVEQARRGEAIEQRPRPSR